MQVRCAPGRGGAFGTPVAITSYRRKRATSPIRTWIQTSLARNEDCPTLYSASLVHRKPSWLTRTMPHAPCYHSCEGQSLVWDDIGRR